MAQSEQTNRKRTVRNNTIYRKNEDEQVALHSHKLVKMKKMENALNYILENLTSESLSADEAALAAGYDPAYFRRFFPRYFGMPFQRFVMKLKIHEAARDIQRENFPKNLGKRYGLSGAQSFTRAFRREIGVSPTEFYEKAYDVPDFPLNHNIEGVELEMSYEQVDAMEILATPLRPPRGNDTFLLDQVSYAYEKDVLPPEKKQGRDNVGIWWYDTDEQLYYCYGPVTRQYDTVFISNKDEERTVQDYVPVLIQGGNYAVFSYPRPEDDQEIPLMSKIMCRYVFNEWVIINQKVTDAMGFTYERFTKDRVYLYLPLVPGMERSDKLLRRKWAISAWADYIDEHITEHLTLEVLGKLAGYSPQNYRDVFTMYYNVSPITYILRRRLTLAASEIGADPEGKDQILQKYEIDGYERFLQQYEQIFGEPPFTDKVREVNLTNLLEYYENNKDRVSYVVRKVEEVPVLMHTIKTAETEGILGDVQGLVLYWFQEDFDDFLPLRRKMAGRGVDRRKVFIWDEQPVYEDGYMVYNYYVGAAMRQDSLDEELMDYVEQIDAHLETIPGGRYAIFTTLDETDLSNPGEAFSLLTRCAFGGWIDENRYRADLRRRTFVMWRRNKLFFYVPVID